MVSTFGSLNSVVTGLQAQQLSINTVGHNISNASTDGYSRQRVNLAAANSQKIYTNGGAHQLGMGVISQSITRIRDVFIDRQYWKENSILGANQTTKTYLTKIEDVFGEPSDTGLESMLNTFWESLETLSTDASNHSARAVVIQNGVSLSTLIQQQNSQLMNMVADINYTINLRVGTINQITEELLTLNKKITSIEVGKLDNANDLRDRRDYLVDQLSYMLDIQVTEDANGAYLIYGSGVNLLTATSRQELATISRKDADYNYEVVDIINAKTGENLTFRSGELGAMLSSRDSEEAGIKKYLNDLSNIAKFLLQEFNDIHKAGIDLNGDAGDNFFGVPGMKYNDADLSDPNSPNYFIRGDWLAHFLVSNEITDPVTGTGKVAARTLVGEATQTNPQSGHSVIGCDPTVAPKTAIEEFSTQAQTLNPSESATPPQTPALPTGAIWQFQKVDVNVTIPTSGVDSDGNVTALDYSYTYIFIAVDPATNEPYLDDSGNYYIGTDTTDGVGSGSCVPLFSTDPDNGSIVFKLDDPTDNDPAIANLTIQITRSRNNTELSEYNFSVTTTMQGIGAGDNCINMSNRLKVDISRTLSESSLDTYYSTQMGVLGVHAQNAESTAENQQSVIDQLLMMRESVCGVNQDEELTNMVRFQKAYNAAARILTAMDEMLDKLINGTGRVGA